MISPVDSIKNIIAPSRWKLLEADDLPMLPDGSLRRYIDEVDRATAHKVADYLRAYTDVANAASAKPYVDNPTIEGTVRTGRFRGGRVSVEEIPTPRPNTPPIRIIQTLLWNCLETLPDEHARLVEGRYLPANPVTDKGDGHGAERWYTLRWANVAPDLAHSLAAGIGLSASATDKKYRKWDGSSTVTLTGTYYPVFGRAGTADDGSAFVEVLYAQSRFSVTVKDNLGVWNESNTLIHYGVPKILAQGIITDWETANPKGSRVNIDRAADTSLCTLTLMKRVYSADVLADQITADNCDAKETTSTYWGLEESALSSHVIPASEDIPAGTAWRRQVSNNGDGSFDVVLTKVETKLRDISVFTGYTDASQSITVKQFKGVTDRVTHLGAYLDAPSAGQSRRWNMQKRDDCSEDWVIETTTATAMPFNATFDAAHTTAKSSASTVSVKGGRNLTSANVATLQALVDAAVQAGTVLRLEKRENDDGSWDVTLTGETVNALPFNATFDAAHTTAKSSASTVSVKGGRNLTAANVATLQALVDASVTAGTVLRLDKRQNDDGSWDVTLTGETVNALPFNASITIAHKTANAVLQKASVMGGRNLTSANVATLQALVDAAAAQGVVYRLDKQQNDDGSWDVTVTKAESQALDIADHRTLTSKLAEGTTVAGRNLRDAAVAVLQALVDAAAVQGVVYRLEKSPNEDGSWDVTVTKAESKALDIAEHQTLTSMLSEGNTVAGRNLRDAAVAVLQALVDAAAVQGVVYRLEKSPNEDGSWDVTVTKAESKALDIAEHQTLTSMLSEGNTVAGRNLRDAAVAVLQALVDAAAVQGVVYRLEKSPNEDGSWDVTVTKAESKALDIAEHQTLTSMLSEGNTVAGRNLRDAAVAVLQALVDAAAVQGVVYRLEKSPNEDGSWDVTVTKAESKALDIAEHQTLTSMLSEGNTVAGRNLRDAAVAVLQALVDAAAVQGVVYRLEKSPNEDGSWDVTVTKAESKALDIAEHQTLTSMLSEGNTVAGRNLRDAAVAVLQALVDAAAVQGVVYRLEKSPNEDGSWDVTVTKAESKALDIAEHQTLTSMLSEGNTVAGRNLRDAAVAVLQALVDAAAVQGVVYRLEKSPNEDGSWDVTVTKAESKALDIAEHQTLTSMLSEGNTVAGRNLRDAAVAVLQALVDAAAVQGVVYRLEKSPNEDGSWDVTVTKAESKALDIAEHQTLTSMLSEGNTVAGRNLRDAAVAVLQALVDAAAVQGVVYRLEKSPNEDGSWDVTVTKAESKALDIAEHQTLTSMLSEGNTVAGRNLRDAAVAVLQALVDAAAVQGVVYRLEKSPNEDGSWDVTVTKAESKALDIAEHQTLTSMLSEGNTVAGRNLRDAAVAVLQALVDAAAVQGVVYRLEKSPNEDGSWDVTVTKAESQALDIAEHQTLTSMLAEGNTVAGRNLRDAAVATLQALVDAAAVQGVVYRLEKSPNEDGSWDVTVTKAESQALNIASHKTLVNHSVEQSETGGRNLRDSAVATLQAMVASAVAGKELRLVKTVREDGTWDIEVVESTAKPQRDEYTYTDADAEVNGIVAQNVDSATMTADYASIPDTSKASASPPRLNAFGLYDYTIEWRVFATTIRSSPDWTTGTEIIDDAGQDEQGRLVIYEVGYFLERGDAYDFASAVLDTAGYTKVEIGPNAVQTRGPGKWIGYRRGVAG